MLVHFKEFSGEKDVDSCLQLQRQIFHFSETNLIPAPVLKLFVREGYKIGIAVGCFLEDGDINQMIGFIISFSVAEKNSLYTAMLGVLPEHDKKSYGYKLMMKMRELALTRKIYSTYCSYEPLDSNLARLYIGLKGFNAIEFIPPSNNQELTGDKLIAHWDFLDDSSLSLNNKDVGELKVIEEATDDVDDKFLICIPSSLKEFIFQNSETEYLAYRQKMRKLFNFYVNQKKFTITDCVKKIVNGEKKYYYLFEKL